ncbi:ribonuclease T2 family protein [[Emmonsia] crescens]|uniref:ribonuclease T2 n=1 Tax=[Emmonsia] crescens TaxID=73230 RepID=A0A0G2HZ27_9EURO|nr:ribonuclease T2 family protein [Emmonsia crescens UAMH 3008]
MPSILSSRSSTITLLFSQLLSGGLATLNTCPANSQLSCHGSSQDTCCFNSPGGLLLLTQFWDTNPVTGPTDSWTIHGLWPDNCDGTYDQYCDRSREYSNITSIMNARGRAQVLNDMTIFWKDYKGNDESFWAHEWNKHGTCISTMEVACYSEYYPQEEVADYFQKTVDLFKQVNTYQTLEAAGIVPDSSKQYELSQIQAAISAKHGQQVTLNCKNGQLNEVWYFWNVKGSTQTGEWISTSPAGSGSSCPKTGIKYMPKL